MEFSPEYKLKVFNALKDNKDIMHLMNALEAGDHHTVRQTLESMLYQTSKFLNPPKELKDSGDVSVYNGAVRHLRDVQTVYNEFMLILETELDNHLKTVS